ncbi:putative hspc200 [Aspergillus varians]
MAVNLSPSTQLERITAVEFDNVIESWRKTPREDIDEMKTACIANDLPRFKAAFDKWTSYGFNVHELADVVREAVCCNNVGIVSTISSNGYQGPDAFAKEAVEHKAKDVLSYFLDTKWDINATAQTYPAVLSFAVQDEDMTFWLLDHGADPNQQCLIDLTPMSMAMRDAPISIIKLLLDRGADVHRGQLLHHAVHRKSDEIAVLDLLLDKGASVNRKMYDDHPFSWSMYFFMGLGTALHDAAEEGKVNVVRYLLDKGADPTIKDGRDRTPLECVEASEHPEIVAILKSAIERHVA